MYFDPSTMRVIIANPRTASTAIGSWAVEHGWSMEAGHHGVQHWGGIKYFGVVRNHWDVWASWFRRSGTENRLSVEWMEYWERSEGNWRYFYNPHQMWPHMHVLPDVHTIFYDKDRMNEKWSEALLEPVELKIRNPSPRFTEVPWQELHTKETIAWIGARYAWEIEKYGFQKPLI
jgi:hypothetical protein